MSSLTLKSTAEKPRVNIYRQFKWMKRQLLVCGYLHCHFGRIGKFKDISTIIYEYISQLFSVGEIWNIDLFNDLYFRRVTPYTIKRITPFNGFWYNTFGTMTTTNQYIWKLRYESTGNDNGMSCMIGIVSHSAIPHLQNANYYCFFDKHAFGLFQNGNAVNGGRMKEYANKGFLSGDIITMKLVYGNNGVTLCFSINDEDFDAAFYIRQDRYNLAVSLHDSNTTVSIDYFVNDGI